MTTGRRSRITSVSTNVGCASAHLPRPPPCRPSPIPPRPAPCLRASGTRRGTAPGARAEGVKRSPPARRCQIPARPRQGGCGRILSYRQNPAALQTLPPIPDAPYHAPGPHLATCRWHVARADGRRRKPQAVGLSAGTVGAKSCRARPAGKRSAPAPGRAGAAGFCHTAKILRLLTSAPRMTFRGGAISAHTSPTRFRPAPSDVPVARRAGRRPERERRA